MLVIGVVVEIVVTVLAVNILIAVLVVVLMVVVVEVVEVVSKFIVPVFKDFRLPQGYRGTGLGGWPRLAALLCGHCYLVCCSLVSCHCVIMETKVCLPSQGPETLGKKPKSGG